MAATTVNSVVNDTNVTGSITAQALTLGWTGTLAKARIIATAVYTDQTNTWSTGAQDMGAATSLKIPVAAGATTTTNGFLAYDSTNHMLHASQASADAKIPQFTVTPVNSDCVSWVVSGSQYKLGTAGAACGTGGGISSGTANGALYATGATTGTSTAALTNGQMLIGSTSNPPVAGTIAGTTNKIAVAVGAGTLTLNTGSLVVHTDQANTWSTGAQDMGAATSFKVPTGAGAAPTASGLLAYDSTSNTLEVGVNGSNATVVLNPMTTAGDIIYGGASGAPTRLAAGTGILHLNGASAPTIAAVSLTADVTGVLPSANMTAASATVVGAVELATTAETTTGTDTARAVTPAGLAASTILRSIYFPAGSMDVSGGCTATASAVLLASGPKLPTIACTDADADSIEFDWVSPDGWDGGTITVELAAFSIGNNSTEIFEMDFAGQCVSSGDTPTAHSTTGEQPAAITWGNAANREQHATTAAITLQGTCAAGDHVYMRGQVDATATTMTPMSDLKILGVKVEYTRTLGTD
jgi:hypothetical protein